MSDDSRVRLVRTCLDKHVGAAQSEAHDALRSLAGDNERMHDALKRAADDSDYCYVCDNHPSGGHAADCPIRDET